MPLHKHRRISVFHVSPMHLSAADSTLMQNAISRVNVISEGSPSRILIVRLISFGITTLPRSSILLTIPVAFILFPPVLCCCLRQLIGIVCRGWGFMHWHIIPIIHFAPNIFRSENISSSVILAGTQNRTAL